MDQVALQIQPRTTDERARHLRTQKMIPAIVYGHGFETIHLKIDYQTFRRTFEKATYSTIINLEIEGGKTVPVLVQDVQYHPVSDDIVHIDFHAIRMDEKVETHLALEFIGASEAVKQGAVLNTTKNEVQISCLPADLVHNIEVDISVLENIGDMIHVSDLEVPKGIEILDSPEDGIVSAIEPRVIEEEEILGEAVEGEEGEAAEGEEGAEGAEGAEKKEGEGEGKEGGKGGEKKGE